jgi:hypothetical protein
MYFSCKEMIKKISIIHFNSLEGYPPIMNIINSLDNKAFDSISVFTTSNKNANWFKTKNVILKRIGFLHDVNIFRYWYYIKFNLITTINLFFNRSNIIVAFETYSILPAYIYKKIFSKTILFIHYHEYISLQEVKNSSIYFKFLNSIEKRLFLTCDWVSQTNEDRLNLLLKDYPCIKIEKTFVAPNLPPKDWHSYSLKNKTDFKTPPFKLVHVGALSLKTMYLSEIVEWVIAQEGKFVIDFYSDNITEDALYFLNTIDSKFVNLLGSINYFKLPEVLINYDVGLTLYNGYIPNHIYSVPNKVYEYLACGLQVWYSKDLLTTDKLNIENDIGNNTLIPPFIKVLHNNKKYFQEPFIVNKLFKSV